MFDFTKEVVINSADQIMDAQDGVLMIKGAGRYFGANVVGNKCYKTVSQEGQPFKLTITPVSVEAGDVQYCVELGLDRGDARGDWGSAMYYFKKPLLITVDGKAKADVIADAFNKVGASYGMVSAKAEGDKVVITGGDDKIKVRSVKAYCINGDDVKEVDVVYTKEDNKVEFGTANYLIHNLRLPTYENYRFTSPAVVEMPIAGAKYTQYVFLYCVERPGLGGLSVVGQTNHSTTTHVFFVADGVDFEAALGKANIEVKGVNEVVAEEGVATMHSEASVDHVIVPAPVEEGQE